MWQKFDFGQTSNTMIGYNPFRQSEEWDNNLIICDIMVTIR